MLKDAVAPVTETSAVTSIVFTVVPSEILLSKIVPEPFCIFSLKVIVAVNDVITPVALSAGNCDTTFGGVISTAEFLGVGVPVIKSVLLLFVSKPLGFLWIDVLFDAAGAYEVPSKQLGIVVDEEPKPTKSMIWLPVGQVPLNGVVEVTNATLAAVALIPIDPIASGVGKFVNIPVAVPAASCIK